MFVCEGALSQFGGGGGNAIVLLAAAEEEGREGWRLGGQPSIKKSLVSYGK